ncbi:MAG: diacylglycerol kinase family protein [candidate division Zixibacteria bacterium]
MIESIDVIATTISGSISDWGKVKRIIPLFESHGETNVTLHTVDSHAAARQVAHDLVSGGKELLISAGGSGTFNAVVEGSLDAARPDNRLRLAFLRKGSADLIGKVLGMPDQIEPAIDMLVESIRKDRVQPCDVIKISDQSGTVSRRFVGYGGAELFGEIPRITEKKFTKYFKGVFGQLFGDLGPFFIGTQLTILSRLGRSLRGRKRKWDISVDGSQVAEGYYQAMMILNGDLGPNLPLACGVPLGSGSFCLFAFKDSGLLRLFSQLRSTWDGSILEAPEKYGMESFVVKDSLKLSPSGDASFEINADGATVVCKGFAEFRIADRIFLYSAE